MDFSITNTLALVALGVLVIVSGGIVYLTVSEWRDRRRREREQRAARKKRS
ncbi:hypothetical protein HRE53_20125 [Acaryochloris sp. 'Moss Beach']|uniref:hypothetical protein n=1 Tax=Acaryochloris TaxID=155977 RepID=UPI001BAF758C|nr:MULTISPECIES: hypothetical protein [Acaryochloris]QUY44004.1 hypothetical protein I1H34_07850 [Acaryochloris marina S15]UJB68761.1 hypothetical protein HRE53_20125 [Acaryochloris sp. 'Moss Beach']